MKRKYRLWVLMLSAVGVLSCEPTCRTPVNNIPAVISTSVEKLSHTSAVLQAKLSNVDPSSISECGFRYAESEAFDRGHKITAEVTLPGSGAVTLSKELTGLKVGTLYKYEVYLANGILPEIVTRPSTFRTPAPEAPRLVLRKVGDDPNVVEAEVLDDGGNELVVGGFCWGSRTSSPTLENCDERENLPIGPDRTFRLELPCFPAGSVRYVNAFVKTKEGVYYYSGSSLSVSEKTKLWLDSERRYDFDCEAHAFEVRLRTNSEVKAILPSEASWLHLTETRGLDTKVLSFRVDANPGVEPRSADLVLRSADDRLSETVSVTQAERPALTVSQSEYEVEAEGGEILLSVGRNVEVSVSCSVSWLHRRATRAFVTEELCFLADANAATSPRTGTIALSSVDGSLKREVTVRQKGKPSLVLDKNAVNFAASGDTESVTVTSNRGWTAETTADWVTITPAAGEAARTGVTVKLTAKANDSESERSATVTFTAEGIEKVLTVTQAGKIPDPLLSIDKSEFVFNSSGGEFTVNVTHNVDYKIHSDVDWIVQSLTRASATDELHFSVAANPAVDARTGRLTFLSKDGTLEQEVVVTQAGVPSLVLDRNKVSFAAAGGSESVTLTSNRDWTAETTANWLTIIPASGKAAKTGVTVRLTAKANDSESERTATVTFKAEGIEKVLTVTQAGKIPDPSLVLDRSRLDFAAAGGSESVTLTSNRDWTAKTSANWLTIAPISGKAAKTGVTVTFTAKANDSESERTATVTFTAEGIEKVLTVTQAGKTPDPVLSIDKSEFVFNSSGGEFTVNVTHNVDYKIHSDVDWIVQSLTRASATDELHFSVAANPAVDARTGRLTFLSKDGTLEQEVVVTQAGKPSLVLDKNKVSFAAAGGSESVTLTSNRDWTAETTANWLTIVPASGKASKTGVTVKFTVKANDSEAERTATVTFKAEGIEKVLTVMQAGKIPDPSLVLDKNKVSFAAAGGSESVTLTSNRDWTAKTTASWLTIVPATGKASKTGVTVKLTAKANDSEAERTATVVFNAEGVEKSLTVTQAGKIPDPSLVLDRSKVSFAATDGTESVTVTSNRDWTARTSADWLTIVPASGKALKTGTTVKLTAKANDSEAERTATVAFKAEGVEQVLTVTQAGKIPDPSLVLDRSRLDLAAAGGAESVTLTSNRDWTAKTSAGWLTIVPASGKAAKTGVAVKLTAKVNDSEAERTATVTFKAEGVEKVLTVTQAGKIPDPSLVLDRNKMDFTAAGGAESVTLTSNRDWTAKTIAGWLTIAPISGKAAKTSITVTLTAKANDSEAERTATVTFKTEGIEKSLTVTQAGKIPEPLLSIDKSDFAFKSSGGEFTVRVIHNVDYEIRSDVDWIAQSLTRAAVTDELHFSVESNPSMEARTGRLTFLSSDGTLRREATVTQHGIETLTVSPKTFDFDCEAHAFEVTVTANVDYELHSDVSWIKKSLTQTGGAGTLHFSVAANPTTDARTGKLTFLSTDGTLKQEVIVTQASRPSLVLDRNVISFDETGGAQDGQTVTVTSNRDWTAETTANWLTIAPASGQAAKTGVAVKLTAEANDSEAERTATVTFKAEGVEQSLTVTQAGRPSLVLDKNSVSLAAAGGGQHGQTVTVTSNRDWTAETTAGWLTITPGSGKASKTGVTVMLTAEANESEVERTATVTFKAEGVQQSLIVTQAGKPSLALNESEVLFTAVGGEQNGRTVAVTSNRGWTTETTAGWLTVTPASGQASETGVTVTLTAEANENEAERTTTVVFKAGSVQKTLAVTQAGAFRMEMVFVEGGTFWMGAQSTDADGQNYDSEAGFLEDPVHQVTLSDYYIGRYEVTQGQWKAVMGTTVYQQREKAGGN